MDKFGQGSLTSFDKQSRQKKKQEHWIQSHFWALKYGSRYVTFPMANGFVSVRFSQLRKNKYRHHPTQNK